MQLGQFGAIRNLRRTSLNITVEQAENFCNWFTERYNGVRRKKDPELVFRLPGADEWEYLASGGLRQSSYPWGGPYANNARGSWLCNFSPVEQRWILDYDDTTFLVDGITQDQIREAAGQDGYYVTAPVDSYFPNDYGLYNMAGNVAEMVSDRDVVKGGSWGSFVQKTTIQSEDPFEGPSPFVGFRMIASVVKK